VRYKLLYDEFGRGIDEMYMVLCAMVGGGAYRLDDYNLSISAIPTKGSGSTNSGITRRTEPNNHLKIDYILNFCTKN